MEQVKGQFQSEYTAIAAAARSGNVGRLREVLSHSRLPQPAQGALLGIVTRGGGAALTGFLAQIKTELDSQAQRVGEAATTAALAQIKQQLDSQATTIGSEVTSGIRESFAEAIHRIYFYLLFVSIIGLLISIFVPQIPLRKTLEHASELPTPAVE